jgi:redox-sensing transcriptional repressor
MKSMSLAKKNLPVAVIERLAELYSLLGRLDGELVSSRRLGELLNVTEHTIRKDLSLLKGPHAGPAYEISGRGYRRAALLATIQDRLGLGRRRRACVVGLGQLGAALLERLEKDGGPFQAAAGFDSSRNRLELLTARTPLYPARDSPRVVRELGIQIGILAVPARSVKEAAERLAEGGIRAILNYSAVVLAPPAAGIAVRNVSLDRELCIFASILNEQGESDGTRL